MKIKTRGVATKFDGGTLVGSATRRRNALECDRPLFLRVAIPTKNQSSGTQIGPLTTYRRMSPPCRPMVISSGVSAAFVVEQGHSLSICNFNLSASVPSRSFLLASSLPSFLGFYPLCAPQSSGVFHSLPSQTPLATQSIGLCWLVYTV